MRTEQLIASMKATLEADYNSNHSVSKFFLANTLSGGWEVWLQVAYAMQLSITTNDVHDYDRERSYPAPDTGRCDVWFSPKSGADIWIELKAQRSSTYKKTVTDFYADIKKLLDLDKGFRQTNVLLAIAVLQTGGNDTQELNNLRSAGPPGSLHYWQYAFGAWTDVTSTIPNVKDGTFLLCTFVPNV